MINLLGYEDKKQLRAARINSILLDYIILALATIVVVGLLFAASFIFMNFEQQSAKSSVADNQDRSRKYASIKAQAESFANNLSIARSILSNEISYSDLTIAIAKALPPNTVLSSLSLSPQTFGSQMSLEVRADSYDGALNLKSKLSQSPLFTDVNIGNITRDGSGHSGYDVTINTKFADKQTALDYINQELHGEKK